MNKNRRITNLLAAGTLIGVLALTFFAFDGNAFQEAFAAPLPGSDSANTIMENGATNGTQVVIDQKTWAMLQDQNTLLRQTVQTLEARDLDYRSAIEAANQTIQQLEANTVVQNSARATAVTAALTTAEEQSMTLGQTVQALQARDGEFRTQLETANGTIFQLEDELQRYQAALQTVQGQNGELARVVKLMQEREVQYQAQLQAANAALHAQANSNTGGYGEHEEGEHEEHEEHDDD